MGNVEAGVGPSPLCGSNGECHARLQEAFEFALEFFQRVGHIDDRLFDVFQPIALRQ